ncbi:nitrate/sulfonate/bicarbonate ABC transporter substrate-binding protein [Candidatus Moduliflexus flocculans]|uniref:Nitrate/sulfonate/bicarbonate ABC transporter substrate-binding protein n=1 Tax=Candidatus Moduliflexus flocculans TaxID=1499966 RepID=A0A0S6VVA3_9BACT|nr:nitrate/sulfonate/bicarbonate ABC transporter substrate-binding protein [Candidatus Moduliflexus flocculans]
MLEHVNLWGVKDPNISCQLVLAKKLGLFEHEGLNVSYRLLQSGTIMPREILRSPVKPLAWTQTVITTMVLREQAHDVKIIAPLADVSSTQQVVIRRDADIRSPYDLVGKKIGMAEGAAIYVAFQNMAKDYGLDLSQIEFVNLLPREQLEAFERHEIDVIASWEPWTSRAIEMGGVLFFSGSQSEIPEHEGPVNWLIDQSMLMTTVDHIQQHHDQLCGVLRAMAKATQFIEDDSKEAARILTDPLAIGYLESRRMLEQNRYSMAMDSMFRLGIYSIRELLYQANLIARLPEEHELYTTELLEELDPALIKLNAGAQGEVRIIEMNEVYMQEGVTIQSAPDRPLSFLLADDSSVIRKILKDVTTTMNGEVIAEATTGREAIAQYKAVRPDIVIMDLSMPDMTGIDAIAGILRQYPDANIIVLSGSNFPETRQQVFELGAKMFIPKPFDLQRVTTAMQAILI